MKQLNLKDRKVLFSILCIVLICVFTLTVAYAALNAVLNISGSAQVNAADWDIHLENPNVTSGSVSNDKPTITSPTTATFSTTLNMPGDFYEFTIDVVNNGSVDAMIENITKTPTLTADQAKYLKYEITYQNGEQITTKQLVSKNSFVRLKVRLEYRKDLVASDLPKTSETLNLGLRLDYIQSDGSGSSVSDNGVLNTISSNDNINKIGTIVTIGTEQFYTIGTEGNNVKLFSMYNLNVGKICTSSTVCVPIENPTGIQDVNSFGYKFVDGKALFPFIGTTAYYDDENEFIKDYLNDYKNYLTSFGVSLSEVRSITLSELEGFGCNEEAYCNDNTPSWIYSTSYWASNYYGIDTGKYIEYLPHDVDDVYGVRPVVVISKDYFSNNIDLISFKIKDVTYYAEDGFTWEEWVNSEYNVDGFEVNWSGDMIYSSDDRDVRWGSVSVKFYDVIMSGINYSLSNNSAPS